MSRLSPATRSLIGLVVIGALCWVAVEAVFLSVGFNFNVGDPGLFYWGGSTALGSLVHDPTAIYRSHHPDHLPGYGLLIALFRFGLGINSPWVMQFLCGIAWLLNLVVAYQVLRRLEVSERLARLGALAYSLFPLTGLVYAVFPLADGIAMLLATSGLLFSLQGKRWPAVLALAAALFIHKFVWPVVGLIVLIELFQKRLRVLHAVLIVAPIALYAAGIGLYYHSALYLVSGNVRYGAVQGRKLPVLDGLIRDLLSHSPKDWVKGVVVLFVWVASVLLIAARSTRKEPVLLALVLPLVLWGLISNQQLVWGLARFGKLMVIPLFVWLAQSRFRARLAPLTLAIVLAFSSQLVYAYHVYRFYAPGRPPRAAPEESSLAGLTGTPR